MATDNIEATGDGHVRMFDELTYAAARDGSGEAYAGTLSVGQVFKYSEYRNDRAFLSFAIPELSSVSGATLKLNGYNDSSIDDFNVYIVTSTYTAPVSADDFTKFDGHKSSGAYDGTVLNEAWSSLSFSTGWNTMTFNAAGRAAILAAAGATLKLALISKDDYDNNEPSNYELVAFNDSSSDGLEPYLSLTYSTGPAITVLMNSYRRMRG